MGGWVGVCVCVCVCARVRVRVCVRVPRGLLGCFVVLCFNCLLALSSFRCVVAFCALLTCILPLMLWLNMRRLNLEHTRTQPGALQV